MAKETAHLTGCGPAPELRDALNEATSIREKLKKFQEDFDSHGFNHRHHGDEILVSVGEDGKIRLKVKTQINLEEFQVTFFTFDTQTQVERLFPALMKGLRK